MSYDRLKSVGRKVVRVDLRPRHRHQSYSFHVFPKNNLGPNSEREAKMGDAFNSSLSQVVALVF